MLAALTTPLTLNSTRAEMEALVRTLISPGSFTTMADESQLYCLEVAVDADGNVSLSDWTPADL